MAKETAIGWTDATWNIARGCSKKNDDCLSCYMMREGGWRGYDGKVVKKTKTVFNLPDKLKTVGTKVFTSSLTDIFHEDIDSFREEMFVVMRRNKHLIYQWLTKRWERMGERLPSDWGNGWDNVWFGCSAGSQKNYDSMMPYLKQVTAKMKWVSLEPLHQPIFDMGLKDKYKGVLSWVVVGGESGYGNVPNDKSIKYGYRKCELEWIESIVNQCHDAGIPVFVKQLGSHLSKTLKLNHKTGADINEFPENIRFQEFPKQT